MLAPGAIIFALNILSAIVALLTSYYAYRANRLLDNSVLRAISLGFMLLGIGLVADAGTSLVSGKTLVDSFADRILILFASVTYLAIQMVAYLVIAVGYARAAYGGRGEKLAPLALAGSAVLGLYSFSLLSYFVALLLLAFVVFQGVLMRSKAKGRFSGIVLIAFTLVFFAHLILLASVVTLGGFLFLVGTSVQFLGFFSLLVFVVRSEIVGPT
ncbi:MAG TPA: hypothetical protein VGR56_04805 [Nitrososphaerales archaeon]|nr:hypothetical protein [Nitrososphaerales archaeon]